MAEGPTNVKRSRVGNEANSDTNAFVSSTPSSSSSVKKQRVTSVILNYDELLYIFRLLDVETVQICALVCKSWLNAAYAPELWKHQIPTINPGKLDEQTAFSLKERGISAINLTPMESDEDHLSAAFTNCAEHAEIKKLTLKGLNTDISITRHFPATFASLQCLTLYHSSSGVITEDGFRRLLLPLINLKSLLIHEYWNHDNNRSENQSKFDYFKVAFSCLPNLKLLDISCLNEWDGLIDIGKTVSDQVPRVLQLGIGGECDGSATLTNICRIFPDLKHISLDIHPDDEVNIDGDNDLTALESIEMGQTSCTFLLPEPFFSLCMGSNNLKAIDISIYSPYFGAELEHEDFVCLSKNAPTLKVLILSGHAITPKTMNALMPKLTELEVLVVSVCSEDGSDEDSKPEDSNSPCNQLMRLVKAHMPKLKSLQSVVVSGDQFDDLDCLKYITKKEKYFSNSWTEHMVMHTNQPIRSANSSDSCLRSVNDSDWARVMPDTHEWHEATGSKFFKLTDNDI